MEKKSQGKKSLLGDGEHQLLRIKDLMNEILSQTTGLPGRVKESIVNARNIAWEEFVKEQERSMTP